MANVSLHEFIALNREQIIRRCRDKATTRFPRPTDAEINHGVPLFLDQLVDVLRSGLTSSPEIGRSAHLHGHALLLRGFSVSQVVHDYGDICQSVTELAVERDATVTMQEFRTLNRCLDDAIASAVTEYGRERTQSHVEDENARGGERLGFLAHEVRNLTNTAMLAFDAVRTGGVGAGGATGALVQRSLLAIRTLIGRSLDEMRRSRGLQNREQFLMSGFINELVPAAILEADRLQILLIVMPVEDGVSVEADQQILAGVVGNLLQNAFRYTRPRSTVTLQVSATIDRVLIEIQDECGGLLGENVNDLFRPVAQRSPEQSSWGLGLAFSRWGAEASNGRISARNVPDKGCVFTVDLPRLPVPSVAMAV